MRPITIAVALAAVLATLPPASEGGASAQTVTLYAPGETPVVLSGQDFAALLDGTSVARAREVVPSEACRIAGVGVYCGPDAGHGIGVVGTFPHCDDSSAWVGYLGLSTQPFQSFSVLKKGPIPTPYPPCFHFQVYEWEVEMNTLVTAAGITALFEGCFSAVWTIHSPGYCPNSQCPAAGASCYPPEAQDSGLRDTFVWRWRAKGPGVVLSGDTGGHMMDMFLGFGAVTCFDLPTGVTLGDTTCPEFEFH